MAATSFSLRFTSRSFSTCQVSRDELLLRLPTDGIGKLGSEDEPLAMLFTTREQERISEDIGLILRLADEKVNKVELSTLNRFLNAQVVDAFCKNI